MVDGHCLLREHKTGPAAAGLANHACKRESPAAPHANTGHVLLLCNGSDSAYTVKHTASQMFPGDRLTVLSVIGHSEHVLQGDAMLAHHGDVLQSEAVFANLGLPPVFEYSPHFSSCTGLPLYC